MTVKQLQCLLQYFGLYTGRIDGIEGPKTSEGIRAFQEAYGGLEVTGTADTATQDALRKAVADGMPDEKPQADFWGGIKYFSREEFRCKCGEKYCDGFPVEPSQKLVSLADRVREHFGAAAVVSSGVRCDTHNAKVGGVANSRHKLGTAMDFCIRGLPASVVLPYVQSLSDIRYAYAIDSSYIHMDVVE